MTIERLQRELESIYRLEPAPPVTNFLVSGEQLRDLQPDMKVPQPQVVFQESEGEILIAVHLGDEPLRRIEKIGLGRVRLSDFCSVTEEISHFLYLVWSHRNQRAVTMLDVELQGEIDKYLLATHYFSGDKKLFRRMFENVRFGRGLSCALRRRYEEANRLGGKFCRRLGPIWEDAQRTCAALSELRSFYRMATGRRLAKIQVS